MNIWQLNNFEYGKAIDLALNVFIEYGLKYTLMNKV
ncbi:acetyltransferase [Bacteroides clarus CAG:160]|nr:acetyltransferase [Bacteroides clarus CAG:160]